MNNIKTIGGAGGIFHILVPGVFLLINIIAAVCFLPHEDYMIQRSVLIILSNPTIALTLVISIGYLLGVLLRMFRCEFSDRLGAWTRWACDKLIDWMLCQFFKLKDWLLAKIKSGSHKTINVHHRITTKYNYKDHFPYPKWLEEEIMDKKLPANVKIFYKRFWKNNGDSKTFVNFCKMQVISHDERAASEIYAKESLCRYIAGIHYALLVSSVLFLIVFIARCLKSDFNILILFLLIGYLIAIVSILYNFRLMRRKEVETVFFATFKNRELF